MAKFDFTPEQLEVAKQAKSPEELVEIAKGEGIDITAEQAQVFLTPPIGEISDEELKNVAGGSGTYDAECPKCGADWNLLEYFEGWKLWQCVGCGYKMTTGQISRGC